MNVCGDVDANVYTFARESRRARFIKDSLSRSASVDTKDHSVARGRTWAVQPVFERVTALMYYNATQHKVI